MDLGNGNFSLGILDEMVETEKDVSEIEKIRDHQAFVVELATKQNIIACLPTGSGKTLIAVELTKYYLRTAMEKGQKIVFLTNTVPLAKQQAEYFRTQLCNTISNIESHHVECLTGDRNVDMWNTETWSNVLSKCEVLIMTAQIFLDAIDHANEYLGFSKVVLLVLDECHHANKSHPMNLIMGKYREILATSGPDEVPRVLGLTASIINGKNKLGGVGTEVEAAEKRLCCKAVTYHRYEEMLQYATNAKIQYITYDEKENGLNDSWNESTVGILGCLWEQNEIIGSTRTSLKRYENQKTGEINHSTLQNDSQLFGDQFSELKDLSSSLKDILDAYEDLGPYCARLAAIQKRAFLNTTMINEMENESVRMMYYSVDPQLLYFMSKIDRLMSDRDESSQIQMFVSEKLKKLLQILDGYNPSSGKSASQSGNELCGIIFVKKRVTAQILNWYLQDAARIGLYKYVRSCCVVGNARCDLDPLETRITARIQANLLRSFRAKKYNLLVATNVVEEGLDVPACNLVVRFDKIESYPSYIQSMGRARSKNSNFYAILKKSEADQQMEEYKKFSEFNVELSDHLKHNATHADQDSSEMDVDDLDEPIIPDFVPIVGGPRITANAAISIAYRYCQTLPCDKLVTLAPVSWWMEVENSCYQAFVQFPSNSVIRDVVEGKTYRSKGLAKRSAFLEACKRLHKEKALDDKLFPVARMATPVISSFLDTSATVESETDIHGKKVGSTKRSSRYRKKIPLDSEFEKITPGMKCNAYELVVQLLEPPSESDQITSALYQFTKRQFSYCLITSADLSVVPKFVLKINPIVGRMSVTLKPSPNGLVLSGEEILQLQEFERYLFGDLLKLKRDILRPAKSSSFLMAPLVKAKASETNGNPWNLSVHWELVKKLLELPKDFFNPPSEETRKQFKCDSKLYEDAVVVPWYRGVENHFFTVMNVMEGTSPLSTFEYNKNHKNYATYYMNKYPNHIKFLNDPEQPLLKVKEVAGNLNFFRTCAGYKKTQGERKEARGNIVELVPEFTNLHPMPASLFIQSKFLPSILQRINRFLSAREIQKFVAGGTPWELVHSVNDIHEELELELGEAQLKGVTLEEPDKNNVETLLEIVQPIKMENPVSVVAPVQTAQLLPQEERKQPIAEFIDDTLSRCILDYIHPNEITTSHIQQVKGLESERRQKTAERKRNIGRHHESSNDEVEFLEWEFTRETPIELIEFGEIDALLNVTEKFDRHDLTVDKEEQPSLFTIMQAITTEGSLDSISLERLETIGDSFLKYCVSRHVFSHFPKYNEGEMTRCRSDFVSNAFLYSHGNGKNLQLAGYLAAGIFQPDSAWIPPAFEVPSLLAEVAAQNDVNDDVYNGENVAELLKYSRDELQDFVSGKRDGIIGNTPKNIGYEFARVPDKSIADSVEALIGAYYLASGPSGALLFMKKLGLRGPCPKEPGSIEVSRVVFGNWPTCSSVVYNPGEDCVENHLPFYKELEQLIGYSFKEPWILVEAFSHAGYMRNRVTDCYQRLEFLGDSLLDFLITNHIFITFKKMKPGDLTDLRSALVNNVTFGSLAVRYGLHTYLRHTSKNLQDRIDDFVQRQREVGHKVIGHFNMLSDFDCKLVEDIEVPKVLGDIFESLAGAIFVDSGMSLDTVWRVFYRLMKNEIDEFSINVPKSPVRELYERFPGREIFKEWTEQQLDEMIPNRKPGLTYVTLTMPIQSPDGTKSIPVTGTGKSKQAAKLGLAKYVKHLKYMNASVSTAA